jgi:ribosome biogenesis ATPase
MIVRHACAALTLVLMGLLSLCAMPQGGFDFASIARKTPGFVGADLAALTKEAAAVAVSRIFRQIDGAAQQQQQQQQQLELLAVNPQQEQAAAATANAADRQPPPQQQQQQSQAQLIPAAAAAPGTVAAVSAERMGAGPLTASELSGLAISMSDFEAALPKVQPSVRREGFTTKPDATWEDVGSLEEVGQHESDLS